jgi:hypothetical protein
MTLPKPKHLTPEYGAQFSDPSIASAYRVRPPYPDEVYTFLDRLIGNAPRVILELGCGLGEIARRLAAQTARVDAVEPSHAMLTLAPEGCTTTTPVLFSQTVEDYVESWHSRNGFSRERMSMSRASEFDTQVRESVRPYAQGGGLRYEVHVEVAWGVPNIV